MKSTSFRGQPPFVGLPDTCSFCGKRANEYGQLFEKNGVGICDQCVTIVDEIAKADGFRRPISHDHLACSFCSKQQSSGVALVAGPGVFICNECGAAYFECMAAGCDE